MKRMNKIYHIFTAIFILFILEVTEMHAQIHIDFGIGTSRIEGYSPSTGRRDAFKISAGYQFMLRPSLGIDVMGQLSKEGEKNYSVMYAKLPVLMMYKGEFLSFGAGLYVAYGFNGEEHDPVYYDYVEGFPTIPSAWFEKTFDYIERFDAGLTARLLGNVGRGYVGLEGSYGLRNISKHPEGDSSTCNHTKSACLLVGFKF